MHRGHWYSASRWILWRMLALKNVFSRSGKIQNAFWLGLAVLIPRWNPMGRAVQTQCVGLVGVSINLSSGTSLHSSLYIGLHPTSQFKWKSLRTVEFHFLGGGGIGGIIAFKMPPSTREVSKNLFLSSVGTGDFEVTRYSLKIFFNEARSVRSRIK